MKFEQMIELIDHVSASNLTSFTYETEDTRVSMKCGRAAETVVNGIPFHGAAVQTAENTSVLTAGSTAVSGGVPGGVSDSMQGTAMGAQTAPQGNVIKSPLVGTFYAAPSEDAPAFVKVGDSVKKGQIVAIVEAMKLMNEIESDFDGKVAEIYVENGDAVEYGQPLMRIE